MPNAYFRYISSVALALWVVGINTVYILALPFPISQPNKHNFTAYLGYYGDWQNLRNGREAKTKILVLKQFISP
jgi:hypothetical protein